LDAVECGEEGSGIVDCETLVWENVAFVFGGKGFDIGEGNIFIFGAGTVGVIEA